MAKNKMRWPGARLAHCVTQSNKEGGVFVRINGRCDFTKGLRDDNDWVELPAKSKNMDLEGEYGAGRITLVCQQSTLQGTTEIELPYTEITDFRAVRVKDKDQESTRIELRFHIVTTDPDAGRLCQLYKTLAKKALGEMTVEVGAGVPQPGQQQPAQPGEKQTLVIVKNGKGKNGKAPSAKEQLAAAVAAEEVLVTGPEASASEGAIAGSLSGQASTEALH